MEVQEAQKQLDALETLSSKNLKQVLAEHSVGFEGVVEKEELIRLARRALTDLIGANAEPESPGSAEDSADGACASAVSACCTDSCALQKTPILILRRMSKRRCVRPSQRVSTSSTTTMGP